MNNKNKDFYGWVAIARSLAALLYFCFGMASGLHAQDGCHQDYAPIVPQEGSASPPEQMAWQGSGSRNDPYQIAELCQLQEMRSSPRAHYELTANIEASPTHNWNSGKGFTPIGPFSGSFNGRGYRISNLLINLIEEDKVGMFSSLEKGSSLQQIILVDSQVTGRSLVGSLVGQNNEGVIVDSTVTGVVSGNLAGGIVGRNEGLINNSHSHVVVVWAEAETIALKLGGFVGQNLGTIKNSSSSGRVGGNVAKSGGFAGENLGGHILGCYATGEVAGLSRQIGGLVGRNRNGTITHSYATGPVMGNGDTGGLAGVNYGHITHSYATGPISGNPIPGPHQSRNSHIGGHTGRNAGFITHSYATGPVSGNHDLGGFAGSNNGQIANSYATGTVSGNERVGGFVGINFSNSTVTSGYASGSVQGSHWVGGFAGYNLWAISNSYAAGKATGTVSAHDFAGTNIDDVHVGDIRESFSRTLTQLQCPTKPGSECAGAVTYSGWSAESWHFGSGRTLPLLTELSNIPASPVKPWTWWESPTKLKLGWYSPEPSADFHELEIAGLILRVADTFLEIRDDGLARLREKHTGDRQIIYSVRTNVKGVVSHPATGFLPLPDAPTFPEVQISKWHTEANVTLTIPENHNHVLYSADVTTLEHFVQIFQGDSIEPLAESSVNLHGQPGPTVIKFSDLQSNSRHRVTVTAPDEVGGTTTEHLFITEPAADSAPLILSGAKAVLRVALGDRTNRALTLRASAPKGDSLEWWVPVVPQRGRVWFLPGTGENTGESTLTSVVVVYRPNEGIVENDRFLVQLSGNNGAARIVVLVTPNELPTISGGREQHLDILAGDRQASLELLATTLTPEDLGEPEWSVRKVAGQTEEGKLNFLVNNQVTTRAMNSFVQLWFTRQKETSATGRFIVSTRDALGGTAETQIIVHQVEAPPEISEISGSGVLETDLATVYLSPESHSVTLRVVAQGGSPQTWVWTLVNPHSNHSLAHFVTGSNGESSNMISGASEVLVRYSRLLDPELNGTSFLIRVTDTANHYITDQVLVRLLSTGAHPIIAQNRLLEKTIPSHSEDLAVSLNTQLPRSGLTWSLIGDPPSGTSAEFLEHHGAGQARLQLFIPREQEEAMFNVRVSASERNDDITLKVVRLKVTRLRLKVFLGGLSN